jgi:hypothetical protein
MDFEFFFNVSEFSINNIHVLDNFGDRDFQRTVTFLWVTIMLLF